MYHGHHGYGRGYGHHRGHCGYGHYGYPSYGGVSENIIQIENIFNFGNGNVTANQRAGQFG